jgi:hypothetical protein
VTTHIDPASPAVTPAIGGYRVTLHDQAHFVRKDRRCDCGRPDCPAIRAVAHYLKAGGQRAPESNSTRNASSPPAFLCPICGAPAQGSLESRHWRCPTDKLHFWSWFADRIKRARDRYLAQSASDNERALRAWFTSPERDAWLDAHRLTYPAQA